MLLLILLAPFSLVCGGGIILASANPLVVRLAIFLLMVYLRYVHAIFTFRLRLRYVYVMFTFH